MKDAFLLKSAAIDNGSRQKISGKAAGTEKLYQHGRSKKHYEKMDY